MNFYLPITVIKRVDKKGCQMYYDQNHFLEKGIPRKNQEVRVWGYFINKSYTDCLVYRLTRMQCFLHISHRCRWLYGYPLLYNAILLHKNVLLTVEIDKYL